MARPRSDAGSELTTLAVDHDVTRCHAFKPGDDAKQGRLSAARRSDEDDELAAFNVKIDTVDDLGRRHRLFCTSVSFRMDHRSIPFGASWYCPINGSAKSAAWRGSARCMRSGGSPCKICCGYHRASCRTNAGW